MNNDTLIQSYVQSKWFVSTIHRESSAEIMPARWFYETIIWEWNPLTKDRGNIVTIEGTQDAANIALIQHAELCRRLVYKEPLELE